MVQFFFQDFDPHLVQIVLIQLALNIKFIKNMSI